MLTDEYGAYAHLKPADVIATLMPPRSRLFHLEPLGIGTARVECLSGYMARLAERHCTTPHYLFSKEVAPIINKPATINGKGNFKLFAKAVNGWGSTAADLVEVFQALTLRRDLRFTTMIPWDHVISSRRLTRPTRAWCPLCYDERAAVGEQMYDQLAWAMDVVTVCAIHRRPLECECPHCGRRQDHIASRAQPGHCAMCRGYLGNLEQGIASSHLTQTMEIDKAVWVAENVGELLAATPRMGASITTDNLSRNLRTYVDENLYGRINRVSTHLPVDSNTVRLWIKGCQAAQLPKLVECCYNLKKSLLNLLSDAGEEVQANIAVVAQPPCAETLGSGSDDDREPADWEEVESVLRAAADQVPPPSLFSIAKRLARSRDTLKHRYPELTKRILQRYSAEFKRKFDVDRVREVLRAARVEEPPPAVQTIFYRLGFVGTPTLLFRRFPKECRIIVARYAERNKRRLDDDQIETELRLCLERNPPPSLKLVAQEIGVGRPLLIRKFPELCKSISSRFTIERNRIAAQNKTTLWNEVHRVGRQVHSRGVYPSLTLVKSMVEVTGSSVSFGEAIRHMQKELGIQNLES